MHRFRAGIAAFLLASAVASPFIANAQIGAETTINQFANGCHPITTEERAGLQAMNATIPANGMFCDKDKPLLYGGCSESPYPYLKTKDNTGRVDSISGLNSDFACRMMKFLKAADAAGQNIRINSAYRSEALQRQLYDKYIACGKCGAPVAPPGRSKHGFGLAIDLSFNGQRGPTNTAQCIASIPSCKWVHANYAQYGLRFPMEYEPWHIEPSGTVNGRQQPLPQGGWVSDDSGRSYTNTGAPYSPSMWSPAMNALPQMFTPLGSTGVPAPTGSSVPTGTPTPTPVSPTQMYDPNTNLPTNYNGIPLPTATSSIFTVPPPYTFPLATTTSTTGSGSQTTSYYDKLALLASSSLSTGTSVNTSSQSGTSTSTQLNDDLTNIDTGSTNVGGVVALENTIATNSVAINPIRVTETFSQPNQPTVVATASSGAQAAQNKTLIVALLTTLRDLLASYLKFLQSQPAYGFQGSWQPKQTMLR